MALVSGESVIAFVDRGAVTEGDEVTLELAAPRPLEDVQTAYRRWVDQPLPAGAWLGIVVAVHPTSLLDPIRGSARHVLTTAPDGDLAIVRVYDGAAPVLSDEAFSARRAAVEGALSV